MLESLTKLVVRGDAKGITKKTKEALEQNMDAQVILNEGLMPGIQEVGDRFAKGKAFVPNLLIAAKAMNAGVDVLRPYLEGKGDFSIGTAVAATVKGDLHDIGKNLVCLMMRSVNINVIDLGSNVDAKKYIESIKKYHPDIVVMSALLTTTMNEQRRIIEALEEAGVRDQVKVMVGGAPVTQEWADEIHADAYTADAAEAASWAKSYLSEK